MGFSFFGGGKSSSASTITESSGQTAGAASPNVTGGGAAVGAENSGYVIGAGGSFNASKNTSVNASVNADRGATINNGVDPTAIVQAALDSINNVSASAANGQKSLADALAGNAAKETISEKADKTNATTLWAVGLGVSLLFGFLLWKRKT